VPFLVSLAVSGAAMVLSLAAFPAARAQESKAFPAPVLKKADPNEKADGTLSPAAKAAIVQGPLPFSDADVAAKAAADRERAEAEKKTGGQRPFSPRRLAPIGEPVKIAGGFNKPGLPGGLFAPTPPDTTGAIGPTRYIQLVNSVPVLLTPTTGAGIFNRTNGASISTGALNDLAATPSNVNSFDPQIIWDATTNRFYYVMDAVFSSTDNRLAFGFSKTADPGNVTTDWCHYTLAFGKTFPDFPKLGDSEFFTIIGVNNFLTNAEGNKSFTESQIIAISKPPFGTSCPEGSTLKTTLSAALRDSNGALVVTPVPAHQIDTNAIGYVVARNGSTPSDKLWFFSVTSGAAGHAEVGPARGVTVSSYEIPASASQPRVTQVLDTSDARNTQAVQAQDPSLGKFAF
jgi:hypothetical protein